MTGNATDAPKGFFSTGLDDVASRWLKNTAPVDERVVRRDITLQALQACEALMFAPRVTFKVWGENVVLPLLVERLGVRGIEKLFEQHAIRFLLWRPIVTYIKKDDGPHLIPLQTGDLSNPEHSDPQASIEAGLRGWGRGLNLDADTYRRLSRLAQRASEVTPKDIAQPVVRHTVDAYSSGRLASAGLSATVPVTDISDAQRERFCSLATNLLQARVLIGAGEALHEGEAAWQALLAAASQMRSGATVLNAAERTLKDLEDLPSIPELILRNIVSFSDIADLRVRRESEEFRSWLWSRPDPGDATEVAKSYLSAMVPRIPLKERTLFKAARISTISIAGLALGAFADPFAGMAAVAAGGAMSEGVSLLDGFFLEHFLRDRGPRRFATDVLRPAVARHKLRNAS